MSKTYAVPPAAPQNHGKTVAAWTMTVGVVAGSTLVALGMILPVIALIVVGAVLIIATIGVSVGLRVAGFGQKSREVQAPSR